MTKAPEIVLKAGTRTVPLNEVPAMLAGAIHPEPNEPVVLKEIIKAYLGPKGEHNGRTQSLTGEDMALLIEILGPPPQPGEPTTDDQWLAYIAPWDSSPRRPTWTPGRRCINAQLDAALLRAHAEESHKEALIKAIRAGLIVPLSHALVPLEGWTAESLDLGQIFIREFSDYAAKFGITVTVEIDRVTIRDLADRISESIADRHPEKWQHATDPDPLRRTIVAAMNAHGWPADGIPGVLDIICTEVEAGRIEARSAFNNLPCTNVALIRANPAQWYVSPDAARHIAQTIETPMQPKKPATKRAWNGALSIDLVIAALLAELQTPAAEGGLKPADAESRHAGVAAAVNEHQLLKFIRELAGNERISPKAPRGSTSSEVGGDWTLTVAQRKLLRNALAQRIDEAVQKIEARRQLIEAQERRLLQEKLAAGRHTLFEAAEAIAAENEDKKRLLKSLLRDALNMKLPVFRPGEKQRIAKEQMPVHKDVEAYWDDLNAWIVANEPRIEFRFPAPQTRPVPASPAAAEDATIIITASPKQRRNVLDQVIDAAVEKAGSRETAAVWIQLKELAVNGTLPFSGETSDRALGYTNAGNKTATFTKKALGQRLRRA